MLKCSPATEGTLALALTTRVLKKCNIRALIYERKWNNSWAAQLLFQLGQEQMIELNVFIMNAVMLSVVVP